VYKLYILSDIVVEAGI